MLLTAVVRLYARQEHAAHHSIARLSSGHGSVVTGRVALSKSFGSDKIEWVVDAKRYHVFRFSTTESRT